MSWQVTVFATPILVAVVIALFLSGYAAIQLVRGRREPLLIIFFGVAIAALIWTSFSALKLLHTDPATKLLFYRLLHVGAAGLPPLTLLFVTAYTDRGRWLQPEAIVGIFLLPAVFVVFLFVNPADVIFGETELITDDLVILRVADGPGFLIFLLYSTVLVLVAIGLVLWETRRIGTTYYPQAVLFTLALSVPLIFGGLSVANVPPFTSDSINLVPTAATISTAALGILLLRYRFFALPPMAYSTAMKHSPDGLFVLDRDDRVIHANDHGDDLLAQFGVERGRTLTSHLEGSSPDAWSGELVEYAEQADRARYYRVFVESLSRGGRHVGWVVVLRDETAQQRQQKQLQRRNEQLDAFATTVSHDLRNPLNVAEGRLELAQRTGELGHLDEVSAAHERMRVMIDQLLALAASKDSADASDPVLIERLAADCWSMVQHADASLVITDEMDIVVEGDPQRLSQVFENLYRNAIEHSGDEVTITVGRLSNRTGFFIEDDGPGIPETDREQIFDPGYTTREEGTGFGLAIVADIVLSHGWEIRVTEGTDGGARFEIADVNLVDE